MKKQILVGLSTTMKEKFSALWKKLSTNYWLAGFLVLAQLAQALGSIATWAYHYAIAFWRKLPNPTSIPMPHIDWVDTASKVLLGALIIMLQMLVKRTRSDQHKIMRDNAALRKEYDEWRLLQKEQWTTAVAGHWIRTIASVKLKESEEFMLPSIQAKRDAFADRLLATFDMEWHKLVTRILEMDQSITRERAEELADEFFHHHPTRSEEEARKLVLYLPPPKKK